MKRLNPFAPILVKTLDLPLLLLLMSSLSANAYDSNLFVGHWQSHSADTKITTTMHLLPNRTFEGELVRDAKVIWTFKGNWRVEGQTLSYHYTDSSLPNLAPSEDSDLIDEVTENRLVVISNKSSKRREFVRRR